MPPIDRLTPAQRARLRPLVQSIGNDAHRLDQHLRDDASPRLLREDLAALREAAIAALRVVGAETNEGKEAHAHHRHR